MWVEADCMMVAVIVQMEKLKRGDIFAFCTGIDRGFCVRLKIVPQLVLTFGTQTGGKGQDT